MTLRPIEQSLLEGQDPDLVQSLMASGVVPVNDKYLTLYNLPEGTEIVILIGGRGGAKTTEGSRFVTLQSAINRKRCVILRDEKANIRESIMNEILQRYDEYNPYWNFDENNIRQGVGIKDRWTEQMLVFSKGFRSSSKEKSAGLKSISDIDIALIEEMEDVRNEDQFNTFADGIRKKGALIIIVLNTPDINHWILKRFFNMVVVGDGFFDIIPKKIKGFVCIKTSFEDNPHLEEKIKTKYRAYGDPTSHIYNPYYYKTAIQGYASSGRKGQILTNVKPITLQQYLSLPFKEVYGQDFGTASPAGFVGVKFDKNSCYVRQINYEPKDTKSLGIMYAQMKLGDKDKIIADSAEPHTIARLVSGWRRDELTIDEISKYPLLTKGFYVKPAIKGPGSIKSGIGLMQSMNLHAVEESKDLWNEIYNWVYAVDKNNQSTDEPVDDFNHLMDPLRYVIADHKGKQTGLSGQSGYFR